MALWKYVKTFTHLEPVALAKFYHGKQLQSNGCTCFVQLKRLVHYCLNFTMILTFVSQLFSQQHLSFHSYAHCLLYYQDSLCFFAQNCLKFLNCFHFSLAEFTSTIAESNLEPRKQCWQHKFDGCSYDIFYYLLFIPDG